MKRVTLPIGLIAAAPVLLGATPAAAQNGPADFQATVQRAISTLDQMQALFARIDQRHQEAAAAQQPQPTTAPAPENKQ